MNEKEIIRLIKIYYSLDDILDRVIQVINTQTYSNDCAENQELSALKEYILDMTGIVCPHTRDCIFDHMNEFKNGQITEDEFLNEIKQIQLSFSQNLNG